MTKAGRNTLETFLVGGTGLIALIIGCYAMIVRYFMPHIAAGWADELVVYLVMWAIWISTSRLVAENCHVHADVVTSLLPAHWQRRLGFLNSILGFFFCSVMAYAACQVVILAFRLQERSESVLQFPLGFYYLSLMVGMLLMAYRYFEICWRTFKNRSTELAKKPKESRL